MPGSHTVTTARGLTQAGKKTNLNVLIIKKKSTRYVAQMLELAEMEFKVLLINMLKALAVIIMQHQTLLSQTYNTQKSWPSLILSI